MPEVTPLIESNFFSHGTVECTDMAATRRFLVDFLGLDIMRPVKEAQYMWKGGPWVIVCVNIQDGEPKEQGPQNHFKLSVASDAEVDAAHAAALRLKDDYGIKQVQGIEQVTGTARSSCSISTTPGGKSRRSRSATTTRCSNAATTSTETIARQAGDALSKRMRLRGPLPAKNNDI